jgi:hypothetical protein
MSREEQTIMVYCNENEDTETQKLMDMYGIVDDWMAETGDADALIKYAQSCAKYRTEMDQAQTVEEIEYLIAESAFIPIVATAQNVLEEGTENPFLFQVLTDYDLEAIEKDIEDVVNGHKADLDNPNSIWCGLTKEDISATNVQKYFLEFCDTGCGVKRIDDTLQDVVTFNRQQMRNTLPEADFHQPRFFEFMRQTRTLVKRQANMISIAAKQIRTTSDAEIWFSRCLLGAPIQCALDDGDVNPLVSLHSTFSNAQLDRECRRFADSMEVPYSETRTPNLDKVRQALSTYCVGKIGYHYPENWVRAAKVRAGIAEELPQGIF